MNWKEITTYEIACQVLKLEPNCLPDASNIPEEEAKDVINSLMLKRVFRALNTDAETGKVREPNWNDTDEIKYSLWPGVDASPDKPGGFGFSRSIYDGWISSAHAGARLCVFERAQIDHLYEHFNDLLVQCYLIIR